MSKVSKDKVARGFSGPIFAITVVLSLAVVYSAFYFVAPKSTWDAQVSRSLAWFGAKFFVTIVIGWVGNSLMEKLFHRYILHKDVVPFLGSLYEAHHKIHHPLTRISVTKNIDGSGRGILVLVNDYPITREEQKEASIFPWYSFLVFAAVLTPILCLLEWLLPFLPWFFAGYGSLAVSLTLYEVLHYIYHLPLSWWLPKINHTRWGWFWTWVYGFHLAHHAIPRCDEGISGGPLFDWFFGTLVVPKTLFVTGDVYDPSQFKEPIPIWPIRWLDDVTDEIQKKRRARRTTRFLQGE